MHEDCVGGGGRWNNYGSTTVIHFAIRSPTTIRPIAHEASSQIIISPTLVIAHQPLQAADIPNCRRTRLNSYEEQTKRNYIMFMRKSLMLTVNIYSDYLFALAFNFWKRPSLDCIPLWRIILSCGAYFNAQLITICAAVKLKCAV